MGIITTVVVYLWSNRGSHYPESNPTVISFSATFFNRYFRYFVNYIKKTSVTGAV